jgi:hypothetical protein
MSTVNIICECILVGASMSSLKRVVSYKPPNPGTWRLAFFVIGAAAAIGASKYAGFHDVAPIHEKLSKIAGFLGACCIALGTTFKFKC